MMASSSIVLNGLRGHYRWSQLALLLLFFAPVVTQAASYDLHATNVTQVGDNQYWSNLPGAIGFDPNCAPCACSASQAARNNTPGNNQKLRATSFDHYSHNASEVITRVRFNVNGRYNVTSGGGNFRARIVVTDPGSGQVWDTGLIETGQVFDENSTCRWRFPAGFGDITGLGPDWNANPDLINHIEVRVLRGQIDTIGNNEPIWVSAFRIKVDTEPVPACSVSPTSLNFGSVGVGQFSDKSFRITNVGGGTLTGSSGESCVHFSIISGGGSYSLGANDYRDVVVRFQPTTEGLKSCTISTGCSSNVSASGTGIGPICSLSRSSLNFGSVPVDQPETMSFRITNEGGGILTGSTSESCDHYSITSGGGNYSLGPGVSQIVYVEFLPTTAGRKDCEITTGCSSNVPATGTGVGPICQISPTHIDYGEIEIGESVTGSFMIWNTGGGTITGSVSSPCAEFSIIGENSYSLPYDESFEVSVQFEPTAVGPISCTIDTGCSEDVDVQGSGIIGGSCCVLDVSECYLVEPWEDCISGDERNDGADCSVCPECEFGSPWLEFGTVAIGGSRSLEWTLTNSGGGRLSGEIELSDDGSFTIVSGSSYSIGPGEGHVVEIAFSPLDEYAGSGAFRPSTCSYELVDLSGLAVPMDCSVNTSILDFGPLQIGETVDFPVEVTNNGSGYTNGWVTTTCDDITILGDSQIDLLGNSSQTFTLRFEAMIDDVTTGEVVVNCGPDAQVFRILAIGRGDDSASSTEPTISAPSETRLLGLVQNPAERTATIRFELSSSEHTRLAVFDVSGRFVRTLVDGSMSAGSHEVLWNGRASDGREVAEGIYFVRFNSKEENSVQRFVLLR